VSVTYLPAPATATAEPPRIAFAVPRKVGSAVVRNRLRRQVKAHLASVASEPPRLGPGAYLVAIRPGAAELDRSRLLDDVDRCLERLSGAAR
jgi:ribonuclease P protein component